MNGIGFGVLSLGDGEEELMCPLDDGFSRATRDIVIVEREETS